MKVKKGMANNKSLLRMPKILSGKLAMKLAGNQSRLIARNPQAKPKKDSEKATGKPMSIVSTRPANMMGAKFCISIVVFLIAPVFRNACPFQTCLVNKPHV